MLLGLGFCLKGEVQNAVLSKPDGDLFAVIVRLIHKGYVWSVQKFNL